ncbi:hypothetical protein F4778DRAFT_537852 [Xylariomycetidae sp. FL2044]|nr:hypothetical protein F4778DRAFT_537852 [Xylariomycetidae sp. FL2044]
MAAEAADITPWLRPAPKVFRLANANVVDVAEGAVRPSMTVEIRDGKIASIKPADAAAEASSSSPSDLVVIDCSGRYLCPGLIDCHVHLIAVPGFNELATAFGNPESVSLLRQPYVCAQMLHRGFTTVRDCGGAHSAIKEAVDEELFPGPRIFIAGHALSQSGGHADFRNKHDHSSCCGGVTTGLGRVCNGVPQCMQAVREEIRGGADFIKIMGSGGIASPTDRLDHLQFTGEEIRAMVECAQNAGTYITAHAYTNKAIRHCVENGVLGIEHGNYLDRETAELMARLGCYLTPTLATYHQLGTEKWKHYLPADGLAKNADTLDAGLRSLRIAADAGVSICYGSDLLGPLKSAQTEEFALRSRVLPPLDVLRSATLTAARMLGQEGALGQIKEGFEADIVFLNSNPLEDVTIFDRPDDHVQGIMKKGRIYKSRSADIQEDANWGIRL